MIAQEMPLTRRRRRLPLLHSWQARVSLAVSALLILVALAGPLLAPHDPDAQLGIPYTGPSAAYLLGTDELGRDVLSRLLSGGLRIVGLATAATLAAYVIGVSIGLLTGYTRSRADDVIMRLLDIILAFPAILLLLVLAAAAGPGVVTELCGVIVVNVPGIARVIRSATLEVVGRGYVEAAVIRGESTRAILFREILPNISATIVADAGPRLAGSFLIIAGLNYLGIGVNPPTPDWGAMIFENRSGMTVQPWAVVAPIVMIVLVTISTNLLGDAMTRSLGRSLDVEALRR